MTEATELKAGDYVTPTDPDHKHYGQTGVVVQNGNDLYVFFLYERYNVNAIDVDVVEINDKSEAEKVRTAFYNFQRAIELAFLVGLTVEIEANPGQPASLMTMKIYRKTSL